jgi:hypothetical protein
MMTPRRSSLAAVAPVASRACASQSWNWTYPDPGIQHWHLRSMTEEESRAWVGSWPGRRAQPAWSRAGSTNKSRPAGGQAGTSDLTGEEAYM